LKSLDKQILLRKIEEMTPHAARRSARNNYPRGVEHHSAVEIEEEREDEEPWSRRGGNIQKLRTWLRVHQLQPELFVCSALKMRNCF
jgi:hypothetical protein